MQTPLINTGLIGYGMAGRVFLAPFIQPVNGLSLQLISTSKPDAIAQAKVAYPEAQIVSSAEAIIADPTIELVVIGTPNTSHFPLAKAAMEAGKHVLVEKPFTITSADADELIRISQKTGRILTVHHNRRFDGDYATVKKLLASGMLGQLTEMKISYDRFRPALRPNAWRENDLPGSGILYDLGSHLIDQAIDLFGMPESVQADVMIQRPGGKVVDRFEVVLHYPTVRLVLSAGMLIKEAGPHYVLHGDKGCFIKYGMDPQENKLKVGAIPHLDPDWGKEVPSAYGTLYTNWQEMEMKSVIASDIGHYGYLFANVAAAIRGEQPLIVQPEQSRNTIRLIELAMQSAKEGRTIRL